MAIEVTVPEMGESILEATVSHWLKKEGGGSGKRRRQPGTHHLPGPKPETPQRRLPSPGGLQPQQSSGSPGSIP